MNCDYCGEPLTRHRSHSRYKTRYYCTTTNCPIIYWKEKKKQIGNKWSPIKLIPIVTSTWHGHVTPITTEVNL